MKALHQRIFDRLRDGIPGVHKGWRTPWGPKDQKVLPLRDADRPEIDAWVKRLKADISHDDEIDAPVFNGHPETGGDIRLIPKYRYVSPDEYYHSVFHELTHWTGFHTRLDRMPRTSFEARLQGKEGKVLEEMVAEFGAAFLLGEFGLKGQSDRNVEYLAPLADALEMSLPAFEAAADEASKAVDYLMDLAA